LDHPCRSHCFWRKGAKLIRAEIPKSLLRMHCEAFQAKLASSDEKPRLETSFLDRAECPVASQLHYFLIAVAAVDARCWPATSHVLPFCLALLSQVFAHVDGLCYCHLQN